MDLDIPRPEDHLGLLIYVKLCHSTNVQSSNPPNQFSFNRILERLRRIGSVNVSENPPRYVIPNFVASLTDIKTNWAEFQQHRKVIGLICVGFLGDLQTNGYFEGDANEEVIGNRPTSITESPSVFNTIFEQYFNIKEHFRSTLVDARCVIFGDASSGENGGVQASSSSSLDGALRYSSLDDAAELEHDIRDYVRALYWVLESKRLDLSFEKQDSPSCPAVPDEEKYFVGLDRTSRAFRKRSVGRLRKQVADITLMTGLPTLAVESYTAAIDQLKSANDWLWLAGAYEGYACAALIAKFGKSILDSLNVQNSSSLSLQRVPTFTPGEMKKAQHTRQSSPQGNSLGQRRTGGTSMRSESPRHNVTKLLISEADIEEKFRLAIESYQKFSFAAPIELECAFKATAVYLLERRYDALDEFLNIYCARFLDTNFRLFTDVQKSHVCTLISSVYKRIGFRRKMAFFTRLSALLRLYMNREEPVSLNDYRQVYPLFLASLEGYHIPWSGFGSPSSSFGGWHSVQIRALNETYICALRANYRDAAARHLALMIQVTLDNTDSVKAETIAQFCNELIQLNLQNGIHNISTHLRLNYGAILPPVQLTKLPKMLSVDINPLPPHLSPCDVPEIASKAIFIYSPFQTISQSTQIRWVCGCPSVITIRMQNLLPFELDVKNLIPVGDGASFDPTPVSVTLPPKSMNTAVELFLTPKEAGVITLTGCSCEVLGVKSICRFDDIPWLKKYPRSGKVEVLDSLPELEISSRMRRAQNQKPSELTEICTAEITLYAGQRQTEVIHLLNASDSIIDRLEWEIQQPTSFGVAHLIGIQETASEMGYPFLPRTVRDIHVHITAIDPMTSDGDNDENKKQVATPATSPVSIPYTGRLLTATIKFVYCGNVEQNDSTSSSRKTYQRCCALTIFVTILPMVVVVDWHVLPGETSNDRYIALDIVNCGDSEIDIHFPIEKTASIQPRDTCRVPVLCQCCDLTSVSSSQLLRGPRAKHYFMDARRKYVQEYVRSRLKVSWAVTSNKNLNGDVPIGVVLTSSRLCKELVMPLITLDIHVLGATGGTIDEYFVGVSERVTLNTNIVPSKTRERAVASLSIEFFQDYMNGLTSPTTSDVLVIGSSTHSIHLGDDNWKNAFDFRFMFCNEGTYKVTITCDVAHKISSEPSLVDVENLLDFEDDLFFGSPIMPILTFNVVSKRT